MCLVGLDGSATSWDAFIWAAGEAKRSAARLIAAYVVPQPLPLSPAPGVTTGFSIHQDAESQVGTELEREAKSRAKDLGLSLTFVRGQGEPVHELLRIACAVKADLIVVGKSTKLRHQLAGSCGGRLARERNAPIVVIVP